MAITYARAMQDEVRRIAAPARDAYGAAWRLQGVQAPADLLQALLDVSRSTTNADVSDRRTSRD